MESEDALQIDACRSILAHPIPLSARPAGHPWTRDREDPDLLRRMVAARTTTWTQHRELARQLTACNRPPLCGTLHTDTARTQGLGMDMDSSMVMDMDSGMNMGMDAGMNMSMDASTD